MEKTEIIVIGGGASGMAAAIAAAGNGASVTIIEKNDRPGKKLLATGNGRCNYTNLLVQATDLSGADPGFASGALKGFNVENTITFFEQLGILPRMESEGRVYPYSEQAASVLAALLSELKRLGVRIIPESPVTGIKWKEGHFTVQIEGGRQYRADKVILASGGKAGSQYGCTGDGYALAGSFGHRIIPVKPALVQLECAAPFFRQLKGVRSKGRVTLVSLAAGKVPEDASELGEIQFTEAGLSGICIFNLSRYIDKAPEDRQQKAREKAVIRLDLIPEMSLEQLTQKLTERVLHSSHKTLEEFLNGIVNKKLIDVILKESKIQERCKSCASIDETDIRKLASILKSWDIKVMGTKGWQEAQVTSGGIATDEVDPETMESRKMKGLYFTGEILDVDGRCGGYNLQWAWSSGYVAGKAASV